MSSHPLKLRIAAIYSGRWWGATTSSHIVRNHLDNFIRPNDVDVFVVTDPTSWCAASAATREAYRAGDVVAAQMEFTRQVSATFGGWLRLHAALVSSEDPARPHDYGAASIRAAASVASGDGRGRAALYMHRWYSQYEHVAKAELFRRAFGPHDVIVRLRLDVTLGLPLTLKMNRMGNIRVICNHTSQLALLQRDEDVIAPAMLTSKSLLQLASNGFWMPDRFADGGATAHPCVPHGEVSLWLVKGEKERPCPAGESLRWMWSDWVELGTPRAFDVFATMTDRATIYATAAKHVRCHGLCQEEQTAFQLEAGGVQLLPLRLPLMLHRVSTMPCGAEPLLNLSELAAQHRTNAWYSVCHLRRSQDCS